MDKFNTVKLFIYDNKRKFILVVCLLLVFSFSTFLFLKKDKVKTENLVYENLALEKEDIKEEKSVQEEITYYYIDIKGYVNNPGVYSLEKGKRVVDVINKAGGLKKDANTSLLNLSMEIFDEMVIVVYSNSQINDYQKTKEKEEEVEKICTEVVINDACICNEEERKDIIDNNTTIDNQTDNKNNPNNNENPNSNNSDKDSIKEEVSSEKININTATKEELMTLSKIGEAKALAIIEYRTSKGLFKTIEEIKNVSGIGDSLFESLKDYITV